MSKPLPPALKACEIDEPTWLSLVEAENERRKGEVEILEARLFRADGHDGTAQSGVGTSRLAGIGTIEGSGRSSFEGPRAIRRDGPFVTRITRADRLPGSTFRSRADVGNASRGVERSLLTTSNELAGTVSKMEHLLSQTKLRSANG